MSNSQNLVMLVLSSPSGAGKTTLTKKIQQKYKNFKISVSHTTRKARPNEINGIDYHFVSKDKFKDMLKKSNLVTLSILQHYQDLWIYMKKI